jgi:hypothetical protein
MPKNSQLFLLPLAEQKPPGLLKVMTTVLLSLYAPFSWLLIFDGPWDERRFSWIKSWPTLPGLLVQSLDVVAHASARVGYGLMAAFTLLVFLVLCRIGKTNNFGLILSGILGLAFSSWNSWLAYKAYATSF